MAHPPALDTGQLAVLGAMAAGLLWLLVAALRTPTAAGRRDRLVIVAVVALLAWISPPVQLPLSRMAHERLEERVSAYRGRSVEELEAAFGSIARSARGPYLRALTWYAPLPSRYAVELALHRGELLAARADD